jgi:ABC-2 type transport system permease protein
MISMLNRTGAVTGRVLSQLRRDHRLVALSLIFPLIVIYFVKVLFDAFAGPGFNISIYVVPYSAFIIHFITIMLTTIVLVRERTTGTLTRMFVSGYNQTEIIGGYILAYTVLATAQSLGVLVEINWLFDLGFEVDLFASLYLIMWLLAIISMAIGILISNFARNEGQALSLVPVVLISMILSGIIIPVDRLPEWTQLFSYLTPLYYANLNLQRLVSGGLLLDDWSSLLQLLGYGVILMITVVVTLREKD